MPNTVSKLPIKTAEKSRESPAAASAPARAWQPLETLRREVDRLFEDFDHGFWNTPMRWPFTRALADLEPFRREAPALPNPAVDVVEHDKDYEITAEVPGMEQKDIELSLSNGNLTIKGEKSESTEEKKKNYYLSERRYGSFQRTFRVPEGVDAGKIEASFGNGVLKVTLPKTSEAQAQSRKISIKPG